FRVADQAANLPSSGVGCPRMSLRCFAPHAGDLQMSNQDHARLTAIELQRVASLSEAARLAGVSVDTLQRHHADKILRLSPRRLGMRVRDALSICRRRCERAR